MQRETKSRKSGSRERLLQGADRVLRRSGYGGTAISDVVRESGAPVGSVYFHFPHGKEQLALEAMQLGGTRVTEGLVAALDDEVCLADGLRLCAERWAAALEASDWSESCPVAATALHSNAASESLRSAGAKILNDWVEVIAVRIETLGHPPEAARNSALAIVAALEGAELIARITCSPAPLLAAGALVREFLPK